MYVGFIDPLAGTDLIFGTRYSATCDTHVEHTNKILRKETKIYNSERGEIERRKSLMQFTHTALYVSTCKHEHRCDCA